MIDTARVDRQGEGETDGVCKIYDEDWMYQQSSDGKE